MKKPPIQLWFEESREGGVPVRRMILEGVEGAANPRTEIWWRFPGQQEMPSLDVVDALVGGHALWASVLGQDMVVHGRMTRGGLFNLGRLLEIRGALEPARYHPIQILPDELDGTDWSARPPGRVLASMSGGLDSTFTVVRHAKRLLGPRSYPLDGLVLVLGFDIPLSRAERFAILRERMEGFAASLDLPLMVAETNGIQHSGGTWPQSAMPLFAGILNQYTGSRGTGLVSAGSPYGTPYFGYAHTPILDVLSSHDAFRLVTDGGGFNRADKIEALLPFPEILPNLRVCWQGTDPTRNCGECEKCVVTRLDFLAAGVVHPPCFDTPLRMEHIARLPMNSLYKARDLFRFCWTELEARGTRGPMVDFLRRRLSRVPPDHLAPLVWNTVRRLKSLAGGKS